MKPTLNYSINFFDVIFEKRRPTLLTVNATGGAVTEEPSITDLEMWQFSNDSQKRDPVLSAGLVASFDTIPDVSVDTPER